MIKFEFNYNGKELINKKHEATLLEVTQDICSKAGVELASTSFLNSDKKVSVYDDTVTAREYIGYIAESAGCFACIDRNGKLCFKEFCQDETEIPLEMFGEYKWGEEFKISKISYEDGVRSFKFGDDTRNNLWINQENMYIVDEDQVKKIYNKVKDLTANTFEGKTVIDPAIDIGDRIVINGKSVIYQGEISLEGKFIAQISSKIQIKQKEETTVKKESQKVVNRLVQSRINQAEGKIEQLVEETSENTQSIAKQEISINGIKQDVSKKVDGSKLGTAIEQNYEHVKVAWNQISDFIQMMIINNNASLAILDKNKNIMMALDKNGQHFYKQGGTSEFSKMGVNTVNGKNYISFSVPTDYNKSIEDGMAWGVITKSDDKFWPIMYVKNFTMPQKNSGGCTGELILDGCNLVLGAINSGIISGNVKIHGDAMPGIFFSDSSTDKLLLSINPGNTVQSATISILDKISFYANAAGSNTLCIGNGAKWYETCILTDVGTIACGTVTCQTLNETSVEKEKKNIERYSKKAVDILKTIDIYKYNFKSEKDTDKKHLGFVIGDSYNYSKEVTNSNNTGVNNYAFTSLCCKAIQEQQEQIEELQIKDKQRNELIQSLIQRIEVLEKEAKK